jgi:hypothetical protein
VLSTKTYKIESAYLVTILIETPCTFYYLFEIGGELVLEFELRAFYLAGRHSTTLAMLPAHLFQTLPPKKLGLQV